MPINKMIETMLEELRQIADTEVHVGKPIHIGDSYVVPVSRLSLGFGAGGIGDEANHKTGAGGGISVEPVAFLVIQGDRAQLLHMNSPNSPMGKLLDIVPDVIEEVKRFTKKNSD